MASKLVLAVGVLAVVGLTTVFADDYKYWCGFYRSDCPELKPKGKNTTIDGVEYVLCGPAEDTCSTTKCKTEVCHFFTEYRVLIIFFFYFKLTVESRERVAKVWRDPAYTEEGVLIDREEDDVDFGCGYYREKCPELGPKHWTVTCTEGSAYILCGPDAATCKGMQCKTTVCQ